MRLRPTARSGYTLLEVMLASVIAVIMMAALYVAIDIQLRQMDEGRTVVEKSAVARALFQRITNDLTPSLGPVAPPISSGSSSGGSNLAQTVTVGGGSGAITSGGATSGGGSTGAAAGGGASSPTSPSTSSDTSTTSTLSFGIGVQGDASSVSIFLTRLNRAVISPPDDGSGNQPAAASDVRRITYFMAQDGGLARQVIPQPTSELVDVQPTDTDEYTKLIREIKQFEVRYYDGTDWVTSWDGSTPGPDGKTPQGPPRAIEITIGVQLDGDDEMQTFKHVIAFPVAPGPASTTNGTMP